LRVRPTSLFILACGLSSAACGLFPSNDTPPGSTTAWTLHAVRVDTVGYLPGRAKVATVVLPAGMTSLSDATAEIFDTNDNLQWACSLTGPMTDPALDITYYLADFTEFDIDGSQDGTYYLKVPSLEPSSGTNPAARSATFGIGKNVFADALASAMTGMYGQRCGTAVKITLGADTWQHGACHQQDAYLDYLTGDTGSSASVGGWHDAGDFGKYVNNGAFSVGMLLAAWDHFQPTLAALSLPIPEHGQIADGATAPMPDFLWEVKWELDWLLTAQQASGGVPSKLTAVNFESYGTMPDRDNQKRYFAGIGTAMTADFVAVMAEAARIYLPYDSGSAGNYLAAAQLGYAYLGANAGPAVPANDDPGDKADLVFQTGHYTETDPDNRLWAAAEMWETTGDPAALADFETRAPTTKVLADFDWGNVQNLGFYTYLLSQRPTEDLADARNPTLVASLTADLLTAADGLVAASRAHAFGRALGDNFYWGSNGSVARSAMLLWVASVLGPDLKYLDTIQMQLDFLLGRNSYDRSQVTMVGYHPPLHPHHGPSSGDGVADPWPGLLVGGANDTARMLSPSDFNWTDDENQYEVNEIAINWVTPFVYATAALTPPPM
jgi:endoglucanase